LGMLSAKGFGVVDGGNFHHPDASGLMRRTQL
jgi:hypothetical protein